MTQTQKKSLTITLTSRAPVRIDTKMWPIIARADDHDGQVECQANTVWAVRVRQHEDGRAIAYAIKEAGDGGQYASFRELRRGELLPAGEDIPAAVHRVAEAADCGHLADMCIANLPAVDI